MMLGSWNIRWVKRITARCGLLTFQMAEARQRSVSLNVCCNGLRYKPKRLITGSFRTYGFAQRAILPGIRHRTSR